MGDVGEEGGRIPRTAEVRRVPTFTQTRARLFVPHIMCNALASCVIRGYDSDAIFSSGYDWPLMQLQLHNTY